MIKRDKLGRFVKESHVKTEFKKGHKTSKKKRRKLKKTLKKQKNKGKKIKWF